MSRFPALPNSRSPTWKVTVILSSLCRFSWKHSRPCAGSWMLWATAEPSRLAPRSSLAAVRRYMAGCCGDVVDKHFLQFKIRDNASKARARGQLGDLATLCASLLQFVFVDGTPGQVVQKRDAPVQSFSSAPVLERYIKWRGPPLDYRPNAPLIRYLLGHQGNATIITVERTDQAGLNKAQNPCAFLVVPAGATLPFVLLDVAFQTCPKEHFQPTPILTTTTFPSSSPPRSHPSETAL
jgi:hypothetical protein